MPDVCVAQHSQQRSGDGSSSRVAGLLGFASSQQVSHMLCVHSRFIHTSLYHPSSLVGGLCGLDVGGDGCDGDVLVVACLDSVGWFGG